MKKILILTLMLFGFKSSFAQQTRVVENYSLGYGFDKKTSVQSFMYSQTLLLGKNSNFAIGTGFRLTTFFANGKYYKGDETKNSAVSFLPIPRSNVNALNIPLILEFQTKKIIIGANFDLVGFAFGKRRDSLRIRNNSTLRLDSLSAAPPALNLGFGGRGTTNNEVYIGFRPQEELTIRVGVSLLYSQYNARYRKNQKEVDFGRFRYDFPLMPFITLVFNFEQ